MLFSRNLKFTVLIVVLLLSGCATRDPDFADPTDPLEDFNRAIFSFNDSLDKAVLEPLAQGYNAITPVPVNRSITYFFNNLSDINSTINSLLQFKLDSALNNLSRVIINSSLGIGGLFDVATDLNINRNVEDFGQTLGYWGIQTGPYIVLPLLGPSTARDSVGLVADWHTDPINHLDNNSLRRGLRALDIIDSRADLLNASKILNQAALDPYAFIRDAYLQKRKSQVFDGNLNLD